MILSMSNQALIFLTTIIVGMSIGFIYDLFRVFRRIVPHSNSATNIEDLLYWLFVSLVTFYIMLNRNSGEIRFFSILGLFLGMAIYFLTLSILFMRVSMAIVDFFKRVFIFIFNIIMTPFRLLYKLLEFPLKFCRKKIINYYGNAKKVLHKSKNYAKIKKKKISNDIRIILKKI